MRNQRGFTMAEMLIVMGISVVLAAAALPTFGRQIEAAREHQDYIRLYSYYMDALAEASADAGDGLDGYVNGVSVGTASASENGYTVVSYPVKVPPGTFHQNGDWDYVTPEIEGHLFNTVSANPKVSADLAMAFRQEGRNLVFMGLWDWIPEISAGIGDPEEDTDDFGD